MHHIRTCKISLQDNDGWVSSVCLLNRRKRWADDICHYIEYSIVFKNIYVHWKNNNALES